MPSATIHFGNRQATSDASLAGAPSIAYNVVVDGAGAVRRRPGLGWWRGMAFRLRRPRRETASGTNTTLLSWRDNSKRFQHTRTIDLGSGATYDIQRELRSLGGYRRRQWRLTWPEGSDFTLAGAEETISLGTS